MFSHIVNYRFNSTNSSSALVLNLSFECSLYVEHLTYSTPGISDGEISERIATEFPNWFREYVS